jgi:hypothetical protein
VVRNVELSRNDRDIDAAISIIRTDDRINLLFNQLIRFGHLWWRKNALKGGVSQLGAIFVFGCEFMLGCARPPCGGVGK